CRVSCRFCALFSSLALLPSLFYTLSLLDALPILFVHGCLHICGNCFVIGGIHLEVLKTLGNVHKIPGLWIVHIYIYLAQQIEHRSEEHTSELQSRENLVCRLLLEKKKEKQQHATS